MASDEQTGPAGRVEAIARSADRLVDMHAELLRAELQQSADAAIPALIAVGAGIGLAATGGLLASLTLVHGLQRATRLPLWACYGLVGGGLGAAGLGLMGSGARRLAAVRLVPRETIATLKDDLEWVRGTTK